MNQIKIINNFLTEEQCSFYISYIDNNLHKFLKTDQTKRYGLLFGKDLAHKEKSSPTLDPISDIRDTVLELFRSVEKTIRFETVVKEDLYVCSFFMAKQIPGSFIPLHYDTDNNSNNHFKYGGVIYLNDMVDGGTLDFPMLGYSYLPKAGDLVIFPSHGEEHSHEVKMINSDRYSLPIWVTEDPQWRII
jgi:hypothetical protein